MKIRNKLLASASALAICLSSSLAATTTNGWFSVGGFEDAAYVVDSPVAGVATWTRSGTSDASKILDIDNGEPATAGNAVNKIVKLDTQGDQLTWTPAAPSTENVVLIDTDVYLVGSDEAPTTVTTGVQTEVYLKNILDGSYQVVSSVLCAHVYDTVGASNAWVELKGQTVAHQSWVKLRIELDYSTSGSPKVSFYVNGYRMSSGGVNAFDVMNQDATFVTSVSFMGTGYIDNFVGQEVAEIASAPTVDEDWNGGDTNGTDYTVSGTTMSVSFDDSLNSGADLLRYVQLTGPDGYVRTYRTSDGDAANFDVSGLAPGSYTITAYYGDAPSVVPLGYTPAASATNSIPAAAVVDDNGKKLRVNVAPKSGLYYTLFVGTDSVLPGDLSAAAASTLAMPDDEDDGYLQIDMPAPTTANGVNLIKIYASDEAYDAKAKAPVE